MILTRSQHSAATTIPAAQLDRLSWPAQLSIDAYGMLVGLRASDSMALSALRRAVPPGAEITGALTVDSLFSLVVADTDSPAHVLYENGRLAARSADFDEIARALESQLHFHVAVGARTRLFVHAGVVGWRGGAIVIPGRTHAGKSTLVSALVRAGATYYSDEYAVLDDEGLVHPFPRDLGMRDANGGTYRVAPESLGAVGVTPLPVSMVVAARHVAGAQWAPTTMSPGETVLVLFDNTLAAQARPGDALTTLSKTVRDASAVRGTRGDASEVVEHILAQQVVPLA